MYLKFVYVCVAFVHFHVCVLTIHTAHTCNTLIFYKLFCLPHSSLLLLAFVYVHYVHAIPKYVLYILVCVSSTYVHTSYPVIFSPLCKHLYCYLYLHTCTYVIVMCPLLSLPGHCSGVGDGHGVCFPQQDGGCCRRW